MSGITGRPTMAHLLLATSFAFGQQWTQLDASGPSSRRNAAAIYDPVGDRMILFGGRGSSARIGDNEPLEANGARWPSRSSKPVAPR